MGQTNERSAVSRLPAPEFPVLLPAPGHSEPKSTASRPSDELTWSATLDPHDDTREIEITDEMVRHAIAAMEREQVFPFGAESDTPPPIARAVKKADVIPFPRRGR